MEALMILIELAAFAIGLLAAKKADLFFYEEEKEQKTGGHEDGA